jgi:hypothetical protein
VSNSQPYEIDILMLEESELTIKDNSVLVFNKNIDALLNLELLAQKLDEVQHNPLQWKWVIVSLFSSIQSFMLLVLRGSNGFPLFDERQQKTWLDYHKLIREPDHHKAKDFQKLRFKYSRMRLDTFSGLYEKIKTEKWMNRYGYSEPFFATPEQDHAIASLNQIRDEFTHFKTDSLGLCLPYLTETVTNCLPVLKFLALDSYRNPDYQDKITSLLARIEHSICNILKNKDRTNGSTRR